VIFGRIFRIRNGSGAKDCMNSCGVAIRGGSGMTSGNVLASKYEIEADRFLDPLTRRIVGSGADELGCFAGGDLW